MRTKKLMCLLLACFLSLMLMAGCTGKDSASSDETTTETTAAGKVTEAAEPEPLPPLKFEIAMSHSNDPYVLKTDKWEEEKWLKAFNEKFNTEMTIRWIDHGKRAEFNALMFASGDIPDIVTAFGGPVASELNGSVQAGIFHPIGDIIEKNEDKLSNLLSELTENHFDYTSYDGKIYGIPARYLKINARRGTFIRMDLIKKHGLDIPRTVEEFIDVLRVFKANGMEYPYSGRAKWAYTDIFFGAYGTVPGLWGEYDGKLMPHAVMPAMKDALATLRQLYEEGLMDPETITNSGTDWLAKIYSGEVGLFNHNANQIVAHNIKIQENLPDAELALIPSPVGPEGHSGMLLYAPCSEVHYINKDFKEPLRFLQLLDTIASDDAQNFLFYGEEGKDYTKNPDGKINWEYPSNVNDLEELNFRCKRLNLFIDVTYEKKLAPFQEGAEAITDWFLNVAPNEGIERYDKNSMVLEAWDKYPDLKKETNLFNEYAIQIVLGKLPLDAFDEFVETYMERGGEEIINEATMQMKDGIATKYVK